MAQMSPRIAVEYTDNATIVNFTDERILEEKDIRDVEQSLASLIEEADGIVLVLDFANVKFMSSAVLGLLIKMSKRIYEKQGKLALSGISPKIYEIFKITRLTKIFDIYQDSETAVKRVSEQDQ
jgi:anti-sigma B factor antagonist